MARDPGAFRVVGIGASAGGLEACSNLLDALPAGDGLAFILVQHLEPTHESMMVDLLATHTWMTVRQAANGMPIEPNHLYIIPPGTYLSVAHGALQVTPPQARHGARLPFDFLLHSLGAEFGPRAICVVLSGTGADGTLGLATVKENGGTVIAQDPEEAAYDGMPRSAIATGAVDMVLTVANIAKALVGDGQRKAPLGASSELVPHDYMPEIIELLRVSTTHDFSLYKPGTLRRRTERRMAMASIGSADTARYLAMLRSDRRELDLLANDLLINVTNFFRDPKSFEVLVETVLPARPAAASEGLSPQRYSSSIANAIRGSASSRMREKVVKAAYTPSSVMNTPTSQLTRSRPAIHSCQANGIVSARKASSAAPPTCISQNSPVVR